MTLTRPRVVISARVRILAWMLLIVASASALTLLVTYRVLSTGVERASAAEMSHEAQQFYIMAQSSDPATGKPFTDLETLFTAHLTQSLPEESETFFTLVDGEPHLRSPGTPPVRLDQDDIVLTKVKDAVEPTVFRRATIAGPASVGVIPVQEASGRPGALVIVEFLGEAQAEVKREVTTMAVVSLIALVLAGGAGALVAGRVLAPIRQVRQTAEIISESDLSRRIEVTGRDDVALLARTFNGMLDRLETAFEGQRKFLDDAGHELRTPITVVRGHLELMGDDPHERAQTLRLVNDELARMARLVDDLTLLARSERPDFLRLGKVGLTDLVMDALTHACALADRKFSLSALPEGTMWADGQRLLQALMQLAANAVKYTPHGGEIRLGGSVVEDRVKLWVSDNGTGISEADQVRLFERFNRGSQQHGAPQGVDLGLGIGLEIVARIAEAHGGTVSAQSVLGVGSTFTLNLPHTSPFPMTPME
ncbi:HAMP domain-containing sensor histidine kinase [Jonesiaceae bacterium BS-20]|uniref:histidine kinase n=1 Tax=Jonesiaceae bacterium BS-20 TaxID=3120821 RepID=A0AAU7DUU5_9MICO